MTEMKLENWIVKDLHLYESRGDVLVKCHPYVGDDGIYVPCKDYVPAGCAATYKMILSKEMFVEAYNKWIKGEEQ